jgi:hypothetical protein
MISRETVDDLWSIAGASASGTEQNSDGLNQARETYTLFVGQKQSGKSSLITAFHNPNKEDGPKPTVALEYLFVSGFSRP